VKLGSIRHSSGPEYESSLEVASSDCRIANHGALANLDTAA
jgi:hypothetical protein